MTDRDSTVSPDAKRSRKSVKLKNLATPPKTDDQKLSDHRSYTAHGNTSRFVSPSKYLESYQRRFVLGTLKSIPSEPFIILKSGEWTTIIVILNSSVSKVYY